MKTIMFVLIGTMLLINTALTQNRISGWDLNKITAIQAELMAGDTSYFATITKQDAIDSVLNYLIKTEFREYKDSAGDDFNAAAPLIMKLTFTGQRDQVYLWRDHATIGKTLFLIDKKVVRDLKKIITHCKKC